MALPILGLWACAIFCACVGYGGAFLKLLAVEDIDWGLASGLGLSLLIALGGLLNLLHAITKLSLTISILPGVIVFASFIWWGRDLSVVARLLRSIRANTYPTLTWALVAFIGLLMTVRLVGEIRPSSVDINDDRTAYLAFPAKMLATGSYAPDPFSGRRITSSLGGYVFLATFPLVVGDLRSIAIMDQGLGLLILVASVASAARLLRVPFLYTLVLLACIVATPIYRHNATAALVGAGLFGTLLLALLSPSLGPAASYRRVLSAGFIIGALCALKSTFVPAAFLIYGFFALFDLILPDGLRWRNIAGHAAAILVAVITIGPWCLELKCTSGTALYPVLGRGFDISAYSRSPAMPQGMTHFGMLRLAFAVLVLLGALLWILVSFGSRDKRAQVIGAALVGSAFAAAFIAYGAYISSFWRYTVPFALVSVWFSAVLLLSSEQGEPDRPGRRRRVLCSIVLILMSLPLAKGGRRDWSALCYHGIMSYWNDLKTTISNTPLLNQQQRFGSHALQSAVPEGATILAHVDNNFAFDFSRNTVFICDTPGSAGPPPGPPISEGAEAWAHYLTSNSIRYIAFSRASAAHGLIGRASPDYENHPNSPLYDPKDVFGGRLAQEVDRDFLILSDSHKRIFDDGHDIVIELSEASASTSVPLGKR
jgi:hypothetical protein